MQDNRPGAYWEGDKLIVRASALGGCLWELLAYLNGFEPNDVPQKIKDAWQQGHELEPQVIERLESEGWILEERQKEGHLIVGDTCVIRYHPDAIGTYPNSDIRMVVEIKCLSDEVWRRATRTGVGSLFQEYNWQLSTMMLAENLPGIWVCYNKETEAIYTEAQYLPPIPLDDVTSRVNYLVEALDVDLLTRPCDDPKHYPCRFLSLRPEPEDTAETLFVNDVGMGDEFNQLTREYIIVKGQIDELEKRKKEASRRIMEMAGNFRILRGDRALVRIKRGKNVHANRQAIANDGVEDRYLATTEFTYPEVKGIE